MNDRRIVVTGGAGFIGSHLVDRLSAAREGTVLVIDSMHRPSIENPGAWPGNVTFAPIDIRDRDAVAQALRSSDVVFHLAAQSSVMGAVSDAGLAFDTNVAGTFNLLQAAKSAGVKRFVFTSSREVYGEPERLPVPESSPSQPKNGYGVSKVAGEMYCRLAAGEGLKTVILRLANVYGPRDRGRVIPLFLEAAQANSPIEIHGGGQLLDFVWIDIVIDALLKAGFGEWLPDPVNIGSGKGVTLPELAERITEITGSRSPVRIGPERRVEVRRFVADISRAQRLLGLPAPADPLWRLPLLLRRPVQNGG